MVRLYDLHPFGSQRVVPCKQEPAQFCRGRDVLFVASAAASCGVEVFAVRREGRCEPLGSFATLGPVLRMAHSRAGDYLVTIEEKRKATFLRAYVNWRCMSAGSSRVCVRMVGHKMEESYTKTLKEQMSIVEMALSDPPLCISCCPVHGDLLVGCRNKLVMFCLKYLVINQNLTVLDFERSLILHTDNFIPAEVAFCAWHIAITTELDVLILKLDLVQHSADRGEQCAYQVSTTEKLVDGGIKDEDLAAHSLQLELDEFVICQKPVELLGEESKLCKIPITLESTELSAEGKKHFQVQYLLFRRFTPDQSPFGFCEETKLHSVQFLPVYQKAFGSSTEAVHFLGSTKPWNYTYDSRTKSVEGNINDPKIVHPEFLNMWWDTYTVNILPLLEQKEVDEENTTSANLAEVTEAVSHMSVSAPPPPVLPTISSEERKARWEQGQADCMGVDSFDNIKKKLDSYLQSKCHFQTLALQGLVPELTARKGCR
ncbi:Hermansky-Pudlak syndrome 3 protein-like isoform X2 [Lagopus muta]|uniref:Hermansky-Pudlak syndrome 3 protein-like isoform X1 n=1 Tax=Lagopus muta TaxID=64668 RepID=UPI0020A1BDC0|nr:Hermansky-Pudlak syndrome 3 protein-like isoform X1 [Lagopus muta]XP_048796414.1 Hermansky-Pudlak syndrome 3 protein-like isoform X2 [Lagopus muta]